MSPDGKAVATFEITSRGAIGDDYLSVYLRNAGEDMSDAEEVFSGADSMRLWTEWKSSSNLWIYYTPDLEVFKSASNWNWVLINAVDVEDRPDITLEYLRKLQQ